MPPCTTAVSRTLVCEPEASSHRVERQRDTASALQLLSKPLLLTFLLSLAGVLALQFWRPLYHLTDDNLDGWLPVFVEFSRRLWSGQNPFISTALFGGGYNHMADPGGLSLLSPFIFLCSPLANTRWYYLAVDLISSLNLITVALAFCWAGMRLRETMRLQVTDGTLVFLSLSYAFSAFNLLVNSSWIGFINPQAAMPVMFAALFEAQRRRAIFLIGGATLFAVLGSHLHPFLYMALFLGLLTLLVARQQHSWEPIIRMCAGVGIATLIILPILAPAAFGFTSSQRQAPLALASATASRLEPAQLAASLTLGPAAATFFPKMSVHYSDPAYSTAVAFSLVNLPLIWMLARKRKYSLIEGGIVVCMVVAGLLITRPIWLQFVMQQLPLLRSLRWPFREIADLNFLLHLLALLNLGPLLHRAVRPGVFVGAVAFGVVFLGAAPTFHPMDVDRGLIFSGQTDEFWGKLRSRVGERPRVIVAAHPSLTFGPHIRQTPFSLLGAYNYAALFGFVNVSGYSPTEAGSGKVSTHRPYHFGGIYWNQHAAEIWQHDPGLTLVELLRNQPSIIRVRHQQETWVFAYDPESGRVTELAPPPGASEPGDSTPL